MHWSDTAIILSARKLGEHSGIITFLTLEHGLYSAVSKGAFGKMKRGICQSGNIVAADWNARLIEQMGILECELVKPVASLLLDSRIKLGFLTAACALTEKILMEREPHPEIFTYFETLITALCYGGDYRAHYVQLELNLLTASGFGIDLERCAATGTTEDLYYVSPKSGCAVTRAAGKPYHERMLILPEFLTNKKHNSKEFVDSEQIMHGMRLCGYFIGERVLSHKEIPMPPARSRLMDMLYNDL